MSGWNCRVSDACSVFMGQGSTLRVEWRRAAVRPEVFALQVSYTHFHDTHYEIKCIDARCTFYILLTYTLDNKVH